MLLSSGLTGGKFYRWILKMSNAVIFWTHRRKVLSLSDDISVSVAGESSTRSVKSINIRWAHDLQPARHRRLFDLSTVQIASRYSDNQIIEAIKKWFIKKLNKICFNTFQLSTPVVELMFWGQFNTVNFQLWHKQSTPSVADRTRKCKTFMRDIMLITFGSVYSSGFYHCR